MQETKELVKFLLLSNLKLRVSEKRKNELLPEYSIQMLSNDFQEAIIS